MLYIYIYTYNIYIYIYIYIYILYIIYYILYIIYYILYIIYYILYIIYYILYIIYYILYIIYYILYIIYLYIIITMPLSYDRLLLRMRYVTSCDWAILKLPDHRKQSRPTRLHAGCGERLRQIGLGDGRGCTGSIMKAFTLLIVDRYASF